LELWEDHPRGASIRPFVPSSPSLPVTCRRAGEGRRDEDVRQRPGAIGGVRLACDFVVGNPRGVGPVSAGEGRRTPNAVLRGIRENERHESQSQFAEAMARVAREMLVEVYPDAQYVQRLESGYIRWPHRAYRDILERLCNRPASELGLAPSPRAKHGLPGTTDGIPSHVNARLRELVWETGMSLGEFARKVEVDAKTAERWITRGVTPQPFRRWKAALILGVDESEIWPEAIPCDEIPGHKRMVMASAVKRRVSNHVRATEEDTDDVAGLIEWIVGTNTTDEAIEQIERAAVYLSEAHGKVSPRTSLTEVLQTHAQIRNRLRSGKQRLRQTRELLRIDSALLSHACLLIGDLGDNQKAAEYGEAALVLAQESGSDEAMAWSVQAKTARWQQRFVESAGFARRGFDSAALSPTKVELAYREANAIALFGDADRARQALSSAEKTAEALPNDREPVSSVWSFPVARQAVFALSVAIHTGDPDGALRAAAMADTAWESGEPRVNATWAQIQAGSSIAYLMRGSLDEAAYYISPVLGLPQELRISTITGYVRRFGILLARSRFAETASAAELSRQIESFLSSSPLAKETADQ
jgi:hypothetical protein